MKLAYVMCKSITRTKERQQIIGATMMSKTVFSSAARPQKKTRGSQRSSSQQKTSRRNSASDFISSPMQDIWLQIVYMKKNWKTHCRHTFPPRWSKKNCVPAWAETRICILKCLLLMLGLLIKWPCTLVSSGSVLEASEPFYQWEFQDPKMEVLYHIRPYFGGIFPYIGLT